MILLCNCSVYAEKAFRPDNYVESVKPDPGIAFGFSDEAGKRLLVTLDDSKDRPEDFAYTISEKGELVEIEYIREQARQEGDTGRQTYRNFDKSRGHLFRIKDSSADNFRTAVVLTRGFLDEHKFVKSCPISKAKLARAMRARIEQEKERHILKVHPLAKTQNGGRFCLVDLGTKNNVPLVSLVYIDSRRLLYRDYPGNSGEADTWRVDFGDEFGMDSYVVLAVFEGPNGIEVITDWAAPEGIAVEHMIEDDGDLRELAGDYRYVLPN